MVGPTSRAGVQGQPPERGWARMRRAVAGLVLVVSLGACGSDGAEEQAGTTEPPVTAEAGAGGGSGTTTSAVSAPSTSVPSTSAPPATAEGTQAFCEDLRQFRALNRRTPNQQEFLALSQKEKADLVRESRDLYGSMPSTAPDEVRADAERFAAAQLVVLGFIEKGGPASIDPSDPTVRQAITDATQAGLRLQSFGQRECGIDSLQAGVD